MNSNPVKIHGQMKENSIWSEERLWTDLAFLWDIAKGGMNSTQMAVIRKSQDVHRHWFRIWVLLLRDVNEYKLQYLLYMRAPGSNYMKPSLLKSSLKSQSCKSWLLGQQCIMLAKEDFSQSLLVRSILEMTGKRSLSNRRNFDDPLKVDMIEYVFSQKEEAYLRNVFLSNKTILWNTSLCSKVRHEPLRNYSYHG